MHFELSERGQDHLDRVKAFMREHVEPAEPAFWTEVRRAVWDGLRWIDTLSGQVLHDISHWHADPAR